MNAGEQGTRETGKTRYQAVPRTLIFVTSFSHETGDEEVLLLKGAPTKRLWANKYNGVGGHVEAGESVVAGAQRELAEETGLTGVALTLRGVININTGVDQFGPRPGVLVFVFVGTTTERALLPGKEGSLQWIPVDALPAYPLVDDLYELLPLVLDGRFVYGHYQPRADGEMEYHLEPE